MKYLSIMLPGRSKSMFGLTDRNNHGATGMENKLSPALRYSSRRYERELGKSNSGLPKSA